MKKETIIYLNQTKSYLEEISDLDYTQTIPQLSNSTIGKHTRHFLECYQCLIKQYASGHICYDSRPRDTELETNPKTALQALEELIQQISLLDESTPLVLATTLSADKPIQTTIHRELLHNYEHTTHHLALIRVGFNLLKTDVVVDENFGFANSTIEHSKKVVLND